MEFVNYNQLLEDVKEWSCVLPNDFDLIVAIPRSGLLPASILSLHFNIPLTTLDLFSQSNYVISTGFRGNLSQKEIKKVLVLDDSISSGKEINKAKELLKNKTELDIKYGVVYAREETDNDVDFYFKNIEHPRFFEWNIMNHIKFLAASCVDIDGVLCRDPTKEENDDGEKYIHFMRTAKPLHIPKTKIKYLVTSRLEKFRKETEEWLKDNNVDYEKLIMLNLPDKETRLKLNNHGEFKAEIYSNSDCILFIESSKKQAEKISEITGKSVLCIEDMKLY